MISIKKGVRSSSNTTFKAHVNSVYAWATFGRVYDTTKDSEA